MASVFLLQHLNYTSENNDDVKIIGVYATRQEALDAITRLNVQPGFCDSPNVIDPSEENIRSGFFIDKYEVGKDHWREGFKTVSD
nr:hypothetical protein [uncultured Desulfobacter sp.]